jgi:hypothetical protein
LFIELVDYDREACPWGKYPFREMDNAF